MTATLSTESFGSLLKFLRKRAHLTQRDLAQAVGYTEAHVCRLEKDERLPDLTTVAALFIPALDLKSDPVSMETLLRLAAQARGERMPAAVKIRQITVSHHVELDLGALEEIPAAPAQYIERPVIFERASSALKMERGIALCGMAGMGKSALAASLARHSSTVLGPDLHPIPVFWYTLTEGLTTGAETIMRQLALFLLALGQTQVKPLVEPRQDSAPIALDQQLILIRTALAGQPALLCFEDVHLLRENPASLSLLQHLIAATNVSLIFTSRENVPLPVEQINVGGLETDEARHLTQKLGIELDPASLDRLLARTDGNPMLLRLAVGQMVGLNTHVVSFLEHLETQPQVASYLLEFCEKTAKSSAEKTAH